MSKGYIYFEQFNLGGSYKIDDSVGIGPHVWIELPDVSVNGKYDEGLAFEYTAKHAKNLGIDYHGVNVGRNCSCCGSRWYEPEQEDLETFVKLEPEYDFMFHDTVYVHRADGKIDRVKKEHCNTDGSYTMEATND